MVARPKPDAQLPWTQRPIDFVVMFKTNADPQSCTCGRKIAAGDLYGERPPRNGRRLRTVTLCLRCIEPVPVRRESKA